MKHRMLSLGSQNMSKPAMDDPQLAQKLIELVLDQCQAFPSSEILT